MKISIVTAVATLALAFNAAAALAQTQPNSQPWRPQESKTPLPFEHDYGGGASVKKDSGQYNQGSAQTPANAQGQYAKDSDTSKKSQ